MPAMNDEGVEFSEEEGGEIDATSVRSKFESGEPRGLSGFLIKSGITTRASHANIILVIFALLCVGLAIWLIYSFYL